jgi:hypothetical protein
MRNRTMRHVSKVTSAHKDYWLVKFAKIPQGSDYIPTKTFAFIKYGGEDAALKAALDYRNAMYAKYPDLTVQGHRRAKGLCFNRNSKTNVITWTALANVGGKLTNTNFSVLEHGYIGAYQMARALRLSYTKAQPDSIPEQPPEPPEWYNQHRQLYIETLAKRIGVLSPDEYQKLQQLLENKK